MAKVNWKSGALLAPLPVVMVSCGDMEKSNIITIGWCGILNTSPAKTYISVRPERYSYDIIKEKGEFVINLTSDALAKIADGCGTFTGRKVDKFAKYGLSREKAPNLDCPMIKEAPISIECKVTDIVPLGSHDMFMADIVAINVDEELFDKEGKMHFEKANLISYMHGEYFELGKKIGRFGFSTDKKKKKTHKKVSK